MTDPYQQLNNTSVAIATSHVKDGAVEGGTVNVVNVILIGIGQNSHHILYVP